MAAIATITLPDAATTPVSHVFNPMSVKGDTGSWANQAASLPIGFETIGMTLTDPSGNVSVYRQNTVLRLPVLKTTTDTGGNSVTTVDYWLEANLEIKIPSRSTLQNRKDLRKLFVGLLGDSQFIGQVESLQHVY